MSFKFLCPKCKSSDFEIYRDAKSFGSSADSRIFSCRCGKQLFGQQIANELKRQEAEFKHIHDPVAEQTARKAAEARRRDEKRLRYLADHHKKLEREAKKRAEEDERQKRMTWVQKAQKRQVEFVPSFTFCAWDPCENEKRSNSKYCSRDCSNKNARHRHKQRKSKKRNAA